MSELTLEQKQRFWNLGAFIREKRKELRPILSSRAFAAKIGVSHTRYSEIELNCNCKMIELSLLKKIAKEFNMHVDDLLKEYKPGAGNEPPHLPSFLELKKLAGGE